MCEDKYMMKQDLYEDQEFQQHISARDINKSEPPRWQQHTHQPPEENRNLGMEVELPTLAPRYYNEGSHMLQHLRNDLVNAVAEENDTKSDPRIVEI